MIPIPGAVFSQLEPHSGWKLTFAHIKGVGCRICVENPKVTFLQFQISKEDQLKILKALENDCTP